MPDQHTAHIGSTANEPELDPGWTPLGAIPRTWEQQVYYALGGHTPPYEASKPGLTDFECEHGPCTLESALAVARNCVDTYQEGQNSLRRGRREKGETEDGFFQRVGGYHNALQIATRILGISPEHPYADQAREVFSSYFLCSTSHCSTLVVF